MARAPGCLGHLADSIRNRAAALPQGPRPDEAAAQLACASTPQPRTTRDLAMRQIVKVAALAASLFAVAPVGGANAQSADPNDTARFLAGMQPSAGSPLAALTQDHAWQQHARRFDAVFGNIDSRQLRNIRAWSSAKLTSPSPVLFYMFSGPDFLYANAFFPQASTYVMSGLEPTGPIPDLTKLPRGSIPHAFQSIEASLRSIVAYSFFQTKHMRSSLVATRVSGTLPILYVFLARSGKTIRDVSLIRLDQDGSVQPDNGTGALQDGRSGGTHGVKIVFSGSDGREKVLYYFSTNVANNGFKASGFAAFCERLGAGDAFLKSASYLMHEGHFSDVRKFLLARSRVVLQDDFGVPVSLFKSGSWQLRPFGHYSGPIGLFAGKYQPKLAHLFDRGRVELHQLRRRVPLAAAELEPDDRRQNRGVRAGRGGQHPARRQQA